VQYRFEDYVLDPEQRELTRGSEAIAAGPQVFDLLLYLVQNRKHVVSKDELLDVVWGGRMVSESTLTSHINAARKRSVTAAGNSSGSERSPARDSGSLATLRRHTHRRNSVPRRLSPSNQMKRLRMRWLFLTKPPLLSYRS
jgi:hypothetical protein